MKLHSKLRIFVSGMLTCALMLGCATLGFAALNGKVSFGTVGVELNQKTAIKKGSQLTTEAGQPIPSSIIYTDATGGGTTYLPLATISRMLELPVAWNAETGNVELGYSGSGIIVDPDPQPGQEPQATNYPGAKAGRYTEVEPIVPEHNDGSRNCDLKVSFSAPSGFSNTISPSPKKTMVSITVTNRSEYPLDFCVTAVNQFTKTRLPMSVIPVGATVTRTFSVEDYQGYFGSDCLDLDLSCQRDYMLTHPIAQIGDVKADIIAVEF